MPLLKPPEPQLATRRLYLRIDESLAQTAEHYAKFLGTDKLDHVISQALEFIFKRDSQFKRWLTEHSSHSRSTAPKSSSKEQGNDGGQQ